MNFYFSCQIEMAWESLARQLHILADIKCNFEIAVLYHLNCDVKSLSFELWSKEFTWITWWIENEWMTNLSSFVFEFWKQWSWKFAESLWILEWKVCSDPGIFIYHHWIISSIAQWCKRSVILFIEHILAITNIKFVSSDNHSFS